MARLLPFAPNSCRTLVGQDDIARAVANGCQAVEATVTTSRSPLYQSLMFETNWDDLITRDP